MVSLAEYKNTINFMLSLTPDECYVNQYNEWTLS